MAKKLTFHVYHPDGRVEDKEMIWDENFRSIRGMINELVGGTLEHVAVLHDGRRADMFVERVPSTNPDKLPKVYGVAVLFDQLVWS